MGNWYRVTKRINGRLYDYWQRTYRVGKSVKTENKYIGPAGTSSKLAGFHQAVSAQIDGTTPYSYFAQIELAKRIPQFRSAQEFIDAITDDYLARAKSKGLDYSGQPRGVITTWAAQHFDLDNSGGLRQFYEGEMARSRPLAAKPVVTSGAISATALYEPEEALHQLRSLHGLTGKDLRDYEKHREAIRREDEDIQYGNLKNRIKEQESKERAAKRKTKGIKSLNPFMAQALVKSSKILN